MAKIFLYEIIKGRDVFSLPSSATVKKSVDVMVEAGVGAILIIENNILKGIFTERDLLKRVVGKNLDPNTTTLDKVMTKRPYTLSPQNKIINAIGIMKQHGFRHVPIADEDNGQIMGIVSIRDLYQNLQEQLQHDLEQVEAYVMGEKYGAI